MVTDREINPYGDADVDWEIAELMGWTGRDDEHLHQAWPPARTSPLSRKDFPYPTMDVKDAIGAMMWAQAPHLRGPVLERDLDAWHCTIVWLPQQGTMRVLRGKGSSLCIAICQAILQLKDDA